MKYYRAKQSHCLYTNDWHIYVYPFVQTGKEIQSGITVKHRLEKQSKRDLWQHVQIKGTWSRPWQDNLFGKLTIELTSYKTKHFNHTRVLRSKKYIRFGLCF